MGTEVLVNVHAGSTTAGGTITTHNGAESTTTDVFYTADGQVFNTVDAAVLHVQKGDQ